MGKKLAVSKESSFQIVSRGAGMGLDYPGSNVPGPEDRGAFLVSGVPFSVSLRSPASCLSPCAAFVKAGTVDMGVFVHVIRAAVISRDLLRAGLDVVVEFFLVSGKPVIDGLHVLPSPLRSLPVLEGLSGG